MTLANWITLLRIVLTPVFITSLLYHSFLIALILFAFCALTDMLDGFIARRRSQKTSLGTLLDPLADKLLLTASFVIMSLLGFIPLWLTIIVVSRDVIISMGIGVIHLALGIIPLGPSIFGKITTTAQIGMIIMALVRNVLTWPSSSFVSLSSYPVAVLTIFSGLHYIYEGTKFFNHKP